MLISWSLELNWLIIKALICISYNPAGLPRKVDRWIAVDTQQTCSVGTDHGYGYGYGYEAMGMGTDTGSRPWVWVRVRVRDHGYGYGYGYDMWRSHGYGYGYGYGSKMSSRGWKTVGITIATQRCTWVPVPDGYQIAFGILVSRHIVTRPCETIPPLSNVIYGNTTTILACHIALATCID